MLQIVIAAVVALFVAGPSSDALAKKPKVQMRATINGKSVKLKKNGSITGGGGTIAFFVIAQTKPRPLLRTLGVGCGQFPPPTVPGPVVVLYDDSTRRRRSAGTRCFGGGATWSTRPR
jgi:hypothetical protein